MSAGFAYDYWHWNVDALAIQFKTDPAFPAVNLRVRPAPTPLVLAKIEDGLPVLFRDYGDTDEDTLELRIRGNPSNVGVQDEVTTTGLPAAIYNNVDMGASPNVTGATLTRDAPTQGPKPFFGQWGPGNAYFEVWFNQPTINEAGGGDLYINSGGTYMQNSGAYAIISDHVIRYEMEPAGSPPSLPENTMQFAAGVLLSDENAEYNDLWIPFPIEPPS